MEVVFDITCMPSDNVVEDGEQGFISSGHVYLLQQLYYIFGCVHFIYSMFDLYFILVGRHRLLSVAFPIRCPPPGRR